MLFSLLYRSYNRLSIYYYTLFIVLFKCLIQKSNSCSLNYYLFAIL
nr:MAG TPA: hypothetical protein [Caudoviricetes sp.]